MFTKEVVGTANAIVGGWGNLGLGPDEVTFGLAAGITTYHHIVPSAVFVGALLDVWPIMGGYGGI